MRVVCTCKSGVSSSRSASQWGAMRPLCGRPSRSAGVRVTVVAPGDPLPADADVVLDERFGGPEYGLPNDGTLEAIRLCARQEGMLTDPVYEGKSMHGMIEMVRNGEFPAGSRVLYAHLGGVPALNAYSFLFRNG